MRYKRNFYDWRQGKLYVHGGKKPTRVYKGKKAIKIYDSVHKKVYGWKPQRK